MSQESKLDNDAVMSNHIDSSNYVPFASFNSLKDSGTCLNSCVSNHQDQFTHARKLIYLKLFSLEPSDILVRSCDNVLKEPSSGFMLLSVKHLSKIRCDKSYNNSCVGTCPYTINSRIGNGYSCQEFGSPNSQGSVFDEMGNEMFGSSSVEAQEFEDCDQRDESDLIRTEGQIIDSKVNNTQVDYHPLTTHLFSKPNENHNDVCTNIELPKYCPILHRVSSIGQSNISKNETCSHFLSLSECNHPQVTLKSGEYTPSLSLSSSNVLSMDTQPYQHICHTHFDQTFGNNVKSNNMQIACNLGQNNCIDQSTSCMTPATNSQFYALPIIGSADTLANYEFSNAPHNSSNWSSLNGVLHQSYRRNLSARSKHANYSQSSITCLHHLHSSVDSDTISSNMNSTRTTHLIPEVVALATASLPPLQPASRFRKARIHETVEQWSHDRFSVHDCHLKAIPDWVKELQKKAEACEKTLMNAVNKKVKCMSCFVPNKNNIETNHGRQSVQDFVHPKINNTTAVDSEFKLMHGNFTLLENYLNVRALLLSRSPLTNSLFSFWDDGSRIHNRLPALTRINLRQYENAINFGHMCDMCVSFEDRGWTNHYSTSTICPNNEVFPPRNNVSTHTVDQNVVVNNLLPESPILQNSLDPATAYLRRQHINSGISLEHVSLIHFGDNPAIVDQMSISVPIDPKTVDLPQALVCDVQCPEHVCDANDCLFSQRNQSPKFLTNLSNNVPPTSPNTDNHSSNKHCRKHFQLTIPRNSHLSKSLFLSKSKIPLSNSVIFKSSDHLEINNHHHINRVLLSSNPDLVRSQSNLLSCHQNGFYNSHPIYNRNGKRLRSRLRHRDLSSNSLLYQKSHKTYIRSKNREHINCHSDGCYSSPNYISYDNWHNSNAFKRACTTGSIVDLNDDELSKDIVKFAKDNDGKVSKESTVLSARLESRIRASMEAIRSTLVNSFHDEFTTILTENVGLRSELSCLNSELKLLHNYQEAISAFRPFVPNDVFKSICSEKNLPTHLYAENTNSNHGL